MRRVTNSCFLSSSQKISEKQCFIHYNLGICGQTYLICINVGSRVAELSDLCS